MSDYFSTTKGDITMRMADPGDAVPVRSLRLEAISLHPEEFAADVEMTAAEGAEIWAERIIGYAATKSSAIRIAFAEDMRVGMTGIGRGPWPKTRHFATIWGVYVNQDWPGLHIGEQLLNGCTEWAIVNGVKVINLVVNISNIPAIRCYSRCGFTI
jgi:ribosomal protein S18 acetylase RimI-like enzyme